MRAGLVVLGGLGMCSCGAPECAPVDELPVSFGGQVSEDHRRLAERSVSWLLAQTRDRPLCASKVVIDAEAAVLDPAGRPSHFQGDGGAIVFSGSYAPARDLAHGFCHALVGEAGWQPTEPERAAIADVALPECPGCEGDEDLRTTEAWVDACAWYLGQEPVHLRQHWNGWCPQQAAGEPWLPLVAPWLATEPRVDPPVVPVALEPLQWEAAWDLEVGEPASLRPVVEWGERLVFLDLDPDHTQLVLVDWQGRDPRRIDLPEERHSSTWRLLAGETAPVLLAATGDDESLWRLDGAWQLQADESWAPLPHPDVGFMDIWGLVEEDGWTLLLGGARDVESWELELVRWSGGQFESIARGWALYSSVPMVWRHQGTLRAAFRACDPDDLCVPSVLEETEHGWAIVRRAPTHWFTERFVPTLDGGLLLSVTLDRQDSDDTMLLASTPDAPTWSLRQLDCEHGSTADLWGSPLMSERYGSWIIDGYQGAWGRASL